ncbi:MAG: hypothetical protein K9G58_10440 [Bacteroidales bacterium]|nr:hypothetical protein [Bacteroidales bacterium]MCF8398579.1 hypothetical protein [Bacteroidales bacterium]
MQNKSGRRFPLIIFAFVILFTTSCKKDEEEVKLSGRRISRIDVYYNKEHVDKTLITYKNNKVTEMRSYRIDNGEEYYRELISYPAPDQIHILNESNIEQRGWEKIREIDIFRENEMTSSIETRKFENGMLESAEKEEYFYSGDKMMQYHLSNRDIENSVWKPYFKEECTYENNLLQQSNYFFYDENDSLDYYGRSICEYINDGKLYTCSMQYKATYNYHYMYRIRLIYNERDKVEKSYLELPQNNWGKIQYWYSFEYNEKGKLSKRQYYDTDDDILIEYKLKREEGTGNMNDIMRTGEIALRTYWWPSIDHTGEGTLFPSALLYKHLELHE